MNTISSLEIIRQLLWGWKHGHCLLSVSIIARRVSLSSASCKIKYIAKDMDTNGETLVLQLPDGGIANFPLTNVSFETDMADSYESANFLAITTTDGDRCVLSKGATAKDGA